MTEEVYGGFTSFLESGVSNILNFAEPGKNLIKSDKVMRASRHKSKSSVQRADLFEILVFEVHFKVGFSK